MEFSDSENLSSLSCTRVPSPTMCLISTLHHLKKIASENGFNSEEELVLANIGDVKGISELECTKIARKRVSERMNNTTASNPNGYPPYPGLPELRDLVARDVLKRLKLVGDLEDDATIINYLKSKKILRHEEKLADLVCIASGSVSCSGSIYAHVKYLQIRRKIKNLPTVKIQVGVDSCHYWKHNAVGLDFGTVSYHDFVYIDEQSRKLRLDVSQIEKFGNTGGGVFMLNLGNPLVFLPSVEDSNLFTQTLRNWNEKNPDKIISVIIDSPYDDFDFDQNDGSCENGYTFAATLFRNGITVSYCHARTKEEFATGSRNGEVISNNPIVREFFIDYKADYIGSDSRLEQEMSIEMHKDLKLREAKLKEKAARMKLVTERKHYFWDLLNKEECLKQVVYDTEPFFRSRGSFYLFLNLNSVIEKLLLKDSLAIAELLAKKGIIIIPGVLFGPDMKNSNGFNKTCVRISFAAVQEDRYQKDLKFIVCEIAKLMQ